MNFVAVLTFYINKEQGCNLNPNWHEAGHFYPPCDFGIGFCQLNLYQNFPNIWKVKIDMNQVILTPCPAY